jgi:L-threonylcarbamoyladenylate synthase
MDHRPDLLPLAQQGAKALREGRLVALPTDTQYALSVLARSGGAVMHCYALKNRPDSEAMPIFLPSIDALDTVATDFDDGVRELAAAAWPGALTLILPRNPGWESLAVPTKTVAVRIPDHPLTLTLLDEIAEPITGSSANRHGERAALSEEEVRAAFGDEVLVLPDAGLLPQGAASTILDCVGPEPRVVRAGAVSEFDIDRLLAEFLPTTG